MKGSGCGYDRREWEKLETWREVVLRLEDSEKTAERRQWDPCLDQEESSEAINDNQAWESIVVPKNGELQAG